jgi:hypothetical protein
MREQVTGRGECVRICTLPQNLEFRIQNYLTPSLLLFIPQSRRFSLVLRLTFCKFGTKPA